MSNPKKPPLHVLPASSPRRPPKPGEPGTPENPIKVRSFEDVPRGSKLIAITLAGVTLWGEGEELTQEEREERTHRALVEFHKQKGWPPPPSNPCRQGYPGDDTGDGLPPLPPGWTRLI